MPQMFPMNWFLLFNLFSFMLIMSTVLTYFIFVPSMSTPSQNMTSFTSTMTWKW